MGRQREREKIRALVSAYLDGELPPEDAAWVGRQIADDPQYASAYRAYRIIRMDMRALPVPDVPPSVSAAIRAYTATAPPLRPAITLRARIARFTVAAATMAAAIIAVFTHGFGLPAPGLPTNTTRGPIQIPVYGSAPTLASLANAKLAFGDRAQVIFTRPMDEATVTQDVHFAPLSDQANWLAPSQVSYDPTTFTLSTTPFALKANTDYRVTVPKGLRDLQGNEVQNASFDFSVGPPPPIVANVPTLAPTATTAPPTATTAPIDTPAPTVVATAPAPPATATPEPATPTDTVVPTQEQPIVIPTAMPTAPRSAPTATTARIVTATSAPVAPTQAATSVSTAVTTSMTGASTSVPTTAPTATVSAASPTTAPKPTNTTAPTVAPSATATSAPPTVAPTPAPTATPSTPVSPNFQGAYAQTANRLGAPVGVASSVSGTQLTFQNGVMVYAPGRPFYVIYPGGSWQSVANPGGSGTAMANPGGGYTPGGAYGAAWTNNKLSGKLGYATTSQESSYAGSIQAFDNGVILQVGGDVYVFFDNGTYSHFGA